MRCALVAIGIVAACHRRDGDASRALPLRVEVSASVPGMSAIAVEASVTNPFEHALADIPDLVALRSTTTDGQATIVLDFAVGDARQAVELAERVRDRLPRRELPREMLAPTVAYAPGPIALRYALRSDHTPVTELWAIQGGTVADTLARTIGVAKIDGCGGSAAELHVTIDPARAAALGVTIAELRTALPRDPSLAAHAIADVVVAKRNGTPIRVRDVAMVEAGAAPVTCAAVDREGLFVEGIVRAQRGVEIATVADAVRRALGAAATLAQPAAVIAELSADREIVIALPASLAIEARVRVASRALAALPAAETHAFAEVRDDEVRVFAAAATPEVIARLAAALPETHVAAIDGDATWVGVRGPDLDTLAKLADALAAAAGKVQGVVVIERDGVARAPSTSFAIDQRAAAELGVDASTVGDAVRAARGGIAISSRLVLRMPAGIAVRDVMLRSRDGASVPMSMVTRVDEAMAPRAIVHVGLVRAAGIRARVADDAARAALARALDKVALPAGYALIGASSSSLMDLR
jgi:multidrug efflux pump subunit AcrB